MGQNISVCVGEKQEAFLANIASSCWLNTEEIVAVEDGENQPWEDQEVKEENRSIN